MNVAHEREHFIVGRALVRAVDVMARIKRQAEAGHTGANPDAQISDTAPGDR